MKPDNKFKFGEWLPDLPDLDNPGITEAKNVLYESGQYHPYSPLATSGAALAKTPIAAYRAVGSTGTEVNVAGNDVTTTQLYVGTGAGAGSWTNVSPASGMSAANTQYMYAQYKEEVIAVSYQNTPFVRLILAGGGTGLYTKLTGAYGDAPKAAVIGIVGQFVVLGDLFWNVGGQQYQIQWCGVNAPHNWPAPNSTDAIAQQSGTQYFKAQFGHVRGICEGDQWSVVLLDGALERMSYTGGATVFGFDTIYQGPGPVSQDSWIKIGQLIYFASQAGFYVTDGTNVIPIGRNKVDRYFTSNCDFNNAALVRCGVHWDKRLIYWIFATHTSAGVPAEMIIFNLDEKKFTHVVDSVQLFVRGEESNIGFYGIEAFGTDKKCGLFTGFPGTAILTSAEVELNIGKRALLSSVTPQVSGSPSSVSVRVGSRALQTDAVTYTSVLTPDPLTGDCNAMVDSRYHRAELSIAGIFNQNSSAEFDASPSSEF